MPSVDSLRVSFEDAVSAGAKAAADSLDAVAAKSLKAAEASEKLDQVVRRSAPTWEQSSRALLGEAKAAAMTEAAYREYERRLATVAKAKQEGNRTDAETSELASRAAQKLQIDLAKAADAGRALDQKLAPATAATNALAVSSGSASFALRNLGLQSIDVAQGLATGQPIFNTLIQQGGQVAQVMAASGAGFSVFGAAARAVTGFLAGPGGLVVAGAALGAGLALIASSAETANRQLLTIQTSLRATRTDYEAMGKAAMDAGKNVAATSGMSTSDARAAAGIIVGAANWGGSPGQLQAMVRAADDLAAVMGISAPDAAKKLTDAMRDPAALAQELAKKDLPGMSFELARNIELMARGGDRVLAFEKTLQALQARTQDAAKAIKTDFSQAIDNLEQSFTRAADGEKSFGQKLGETVLAPLTSVINKISELTNSLNDLTKNQGVKDFFQNLAAAMGAAINPLGMFFSGAKGLLSPSGGGSLPSPVTVGGADIPPEIRALLNTIAGPESGGRFNVRYSPQGAQYFSDFSRHPNVREFTGRPGEISTAAGYLQFTKTTWDEILGRLNLPDFGPASQEYGGQDLATRTYREKTGRDLLVDIRAGGRGSDITAALNGRWPSLPGGSQQLITQAQFNAALSGQLNALTGTTGGGQMYGPFAPGFGAARTSSDVLNDATRAADRIGGPAAAAATTGADMTALTAGIKQLKEEGRGASDEMTRYKEALQAATLANYDAIPAVDKAARELNIQAAGNELIAASWEKGASAAARATIQVQAEMEAAKFAARGTAEYASAVNTLSAAYTSQASAQQLVGARSQQNDQQKQLEYLRAETATLGQSAEIRTHDLAVLKARIEVEKQFPLLAQAEKDKLVQNSALIADATFQFQRQQEALNEIGNVATNAFNQVGSAMVNAFVGGQGAAVNFGNVARGILTSVLNEVLKLAVLNPILNSLTGGSRVTLGGIGGALGSVLGNGSGGGSGGTMDALSAASSGYSGISSLMEALGYKSVASQLGNYLGLTGQGGMLSGVSNYLGLSGIGSTVSSYLATPALGYSATGLAPYIGAEGAASLASATIGNALGVVGGIGAGYGLGSLSGGLIQSSLSKTGPGPQIGAGVGALGGALAGAAATSWSGPGAIIGALIGGLIGGSGGGLIGPHTASAYAGTEIGLTGGQVVVGNSFSQVTGSNRDTVVTDVQTLNSWLRDSGIGIADMGNVTQIGTAGDGTVDPWKVSDLATAFPRFTFASNDNMVNSVIAGKSYETLGDLQSAYGFITQTVPALRDAGKASGTLNDQIAALTKSWHAATDQARAVGYAEEELAHLRDVAIGDVINKAQALHDLTIQGFNFRTRAANGSDPQALALDQFDASAKKQRSEFTDQLVSVYGDIYKSTSKYADDMAALETALGAERLAIQKQYNDRLGQTATASVTSLLDYTRRLQTGSMSPLSAQDQLSLARSQFQAVAGAAGAGNFASLSQIPGYADTFLNASRVVNGSGTGYVQDFQRVLDALNAAANATPDTLTASILVSETRTQTEILVTQLEALRVAVNQVSAQLNQSSMTPARIAA